MHNTYLHLAPRLTLPLLIALNLGLAHAQSIDPDCQAVVDAAQSATDRTLGSIDNVAINTTQAVQRSRGCVDQIVNGAVRTIPSFGGGLIDTITSSLTKNLANSACQLMSSTQRAVERQVQTQVYNAVGNAVGTSNPVNRSVNQVLQQTTQQTTQQVIQQSQTTSDSIWSRLGSIF